MKGSSKTRLSIFSIGIARDEAEFRENVRCVLNSANTHLGKVTSIVVRRTLSGDTLSLRTLAAYPISPTSWARKPFSSQRGRTSTGRELDQQVAHPLRLVPIKDRLVHLEVVVREDVSERSLHASPQRRTRDESRHIDLPTIIGKRHHTDDVIQHTTRAAKELFLHRTATLRHDGSSVQVQVVRMNIQMRSWTSSLTSSARSWSSSSASARASRCFALVSVRAETNLTRCCLISFTNFSVA